jgi:filamentous hemagglutinin
MGLYNLINGQIVYSTSYDGPINNSSQESSSGTQVNSKTLWKGSGKERIDVENPNPSKRPGQIHYQDNSGNKYIFDPSTGKFKNAPKKVNDLLNNEKFKSAIEKGLKYLGLKQ